MSNSLPAGLLTCHGKEVAVADPLAKVGYAIFIISQFDTDTLGTFTGEIAGKASKRVNTMDEALVFAARIGFPQHRIIVRQPGQSAFNKS